MWRADDEPLWAMCNSTSKAQIHFSILLPNGRLAGYRFTLDLADMKSDDLGRAAVKGIDIVGQLLLPVLEGALREQEECRGKDLGNPHEPEGR